MAGTEVGSLYYDLNIDDSNLKKQLDEADQSVKSFGDRMNQYWGASVSASKGLLLGLTAATVAVTAFGVSSLKAFEDSQNLIAQTNAVLKSTGQIAGVTAQAVTDLATALEKQTKFSDEDVRSVENLLLTFTSIGKDIFPQATTTVLDMATALGEDTKSASIQLGKALQDPILGVTALRRVGVNFNQAQQDVIKNLVDTGQSAKAQQLIMAELNREFGGSAKAAGDTFAGALAKLKNQFNNVQEAIGGLIAKALTPLLDSLFKWFDKIGGVDGVMKALGETLKRVQPYIPEIAGAILGMLVPAIVAMTISFGEFLLTLAPWAALGVGIVLLFQHFGISMSDVTNAIMALYNSVSGYLVPVFAFLKQVWDALYPSLAALAMAIWQNLLPALVQIWDAVVRLWNALNPGLMQVLKVIAVVIGVELYAQIWLMINATRIAIDVLSWIISVISNLIKWVANLIQWYGNAYAMIINFFKGLPGVIGSVLGSVGSWLYDAGKNLIQGLINGVTDKIDDLKNAVRNGVQSAVSSVKSFLGIHSPSTVFHDIGKNVTEGFVNGINDSASMAISAMGNLGGNIISPNIGSPSGAGAGDTSTINHGDTVINIGQVNNAQDENLVMRRINRNQQLESMGLSPIGGF